MLLYYITDRAHFPGTESHRQECLLKKISEAARAGVEYIQLREKDLPGRALESLAKGAAQLINESRSCTRLLINSRTDVALAAKAHGIHLTSNDISPADAKKIWREAQSPVDPIIAVSCHTETEVLAAERGPDRVAAGVNAPPAASFAVFGPIFEKEGAKGMTWMDELKKVCQHRIPVLALGGVTTENAHLCLEAGASGIAGIRLFQENNIAEVVKRLRGLK